MAERAGSSTSLSLIHILVVVDLPAQCFGHGTVDLIGVHDCREDVYKRQDLLHDWQERYKPATPEEPHDPRFEDCLLYTSHIFSERLQL